MQPGEKTAKGFCKYESIKTKSYISTRHRKKKQKKQQEVWFLTGKMPPRAKCSVTAALCHSRGISSPQHSSARNQLPPCSCWGQAQPLSSFLHSHLHKAEGEFPAEPQVTPKHTKCLSCGNNSPASLCPCSAH